MLGRMQADLAAGRCWRWRSARRRPAAQQFINVLTGGTSGVYYPLGVALSEIYAEGIEGARTQVQATKASVENLNLLQQGKGEIAFSLGDSVKRGGRGRHRGGLPRAARQAARASRRSIPTTSRSSPAPKSGIETLEDLKGKSLSVGAPASGTELNARAIFAAAGMSYDDLGRVEYLPFAELVELIKNRQLDATLQSAGLGRRLDPRPRDLGADHRGRGAAGDRRGDRRALPGRDDPGRHLRRPGGGRGDGGGRQLPRHPRRTCRRRPSTR